MSEQMERDLRVLLDLFVDSNHHLQDENAKLQKLVWDMLHWMPCHRPCSSCERYEYPNGCEFERRGRELGIEAPE